MAFFGKLGLKSRRLLNRLLNRKMDMPEFASTLEQLFIVVKEEVKDIVSEEMVELWDMIVENTPIDLGVAQFNWQMGDKNDGSILREDVLEAKAEGKYGFYAGRARVVLPPTKLNPVDFRDNKVIVIFNNVDYIEDLKDGSSSQAARGQMVDDNVAIMERLIEKRLRATGIFK